MRLATAVFVAALANPALGQVPPRDAGVDDANFGPATKQEVFASRKALLEGTNVYLENMVVRAKSGLMARLGSGRHEIFVAPNDPSTLDYIAVGATVDVRGTLVKTPSAGQARLIYAMSTRESRRIARDSVYVDAWALVARE